MNTITLAHYYTTPDVQAAADHVGDSLELALKAKESDADRIVFAGVRFMAETAKIINPDAEVILPDAGSSCSLVKQTDVGQLRYWVNYWKFKQDKPAIHIAYINSSAEHKVYTDIIVTSRNVEEICQYYHDKGFRILFSPDANMGKYLRFQHPDWDIRLWDAVCEVHDKFKEEEIDKAWKQWTDGPKNLLAHPESPLPVLKRANFVGSTSKMLEWVKNYGNHVGTIYVATEDGLLHNMRTARPDLDIRQLGNYDGCQCNSCPYMKLNTLDKVLAAKKGIGTSINYLTDRVMIKARLPIERMLKFKE